MTNETKSKIVLPFNEAIIMKPFTRVILLISCHCMLIASLALAGVGMSVEISPGEFISVANLNTKSITVTCSPSANDKKTTIGISWRYNESGLMLKEPNKTKETKEEKVEILCDKKEHVISAPKIGKTQTGGPSISNHGPLFVVIEW